MDKFSFYDFIAFLVPGGTFVALLIWFLNLNKPEFASIKLPDMAVLIIPFLFVSFIIGHILSGLGKTIERILHKKKPIYSKHLKEYPADIKLLAQLSKEKFGIDILIDNTHNEGRLAELFDKLADYLEVQDKDSKTVILFGQHVFFRNATALFLLSAFSLKSKNARFQPLLWIN